ncbi:armadillo/beta-catenin-like repeat protein, putative [Eimeria mitis]|uniref:Armadillo/beta-catenin-like repeat protein, putative n=1 Tax=Eimeria mitis TaxID=44415 RepID=U6JSG8_9EIME|nr:armadillo/beta-catenin-like repeat protein, putative [Eimeria mitis]CDJ28390.1 armadillo/beta-catenin-like repeat protein, putative [Eimeria mitis]
MSRTITQVFEEFQRARSHFVQTLADLTQRPQNIDGLRAAGALRLLRPLLLDSIPGIQQTAAVAVGRLAGHSEEAARECVNEEILPHLVASVAEQNRFYRRSAAFVMRSIAKHSAELAQAVVDSGALAALSQCLEAFDPQAVVEAEALPKTLHCLKDPDDLVRKNAATCVREIVKHTPQLALFAANAGAIAALIDLIQETTGPTRVAGILALGYIGAFTETLALAIIVQKGIPPLKNALETETEDHAKAAAAWAVGQLGRHTPDHAMAVAEADILRLLLSAFLASESSDELKAKAKRALKNIIQMCTHLTALETLLGEAPPSILKCIVQQFAKVLPNDPKARRAFVQTGALETLLKIRETDAATEVLDYIQSVCNLYPPEVVNYYSPGYSAILIEKIDAQA